MQDWREGSPGTEYFFAGASGEYTVQVVAFNDARNRDGSIGKRSDAGSATASVFDPPVPGRPGVTVTSATIDTVTFSWSRGNEHGLATQYWHRITVDGDRGEWVPTGADPNVSASISGARDGDRVTVEVRASNDERPNEFSEIASDSMTIEVADDP